MHKSSHSHLLPVLLSFQQFPVGSNLNVQCQLHIHQLLILANLKGHVLLSSVQSFLQVSDAEFSILYCQLAALLSLCNLSFQTVALRRESEQRIKPSVVFITQGTTHTVS